VELLSLWAEYLRYLSYSCQGFSYDCGKVANVSDSDGSTKPPRAQAGRQGEEIPGGPRVWAALGRTIKLERVARGWERKDLAERTGISYPYLSEIETGKKRPSWSALGTIAEVFGLRPSDLLGAAESWSDAAADEISAPASRMRESSVAPSWLAGRSKPGMSTRAGMAPMQMRSERSEPRERAQLLRELIEHLEELPTQDLARLASLARSFREEPPEI